jgi:hypothetical protein
VLYSTGRVPVDRVEPRPDGSGDHQGVNHGAEPPWLGSRAGCGNPRRGSG